LDFEFPPSVPIAAHPAVVMESAVALLPDTSTAALAALVTHEAFTTTEIETRFGQIEETLLSQSRYLLKPNFERIHPRDLEILFRACDQSVFRGRLSPALAKTALRFRLSTRMTSAGGRTTRFRSREGNILYEITIACGLLFQGFSDQDRPIHVCGLHCESRLQALVRIFEHELLHLVEYLCWNDSNCSGPRFQDIARRFFGHCSHTHELITWKERALTSGIRIGSLVSFVFEGTRLEGRVNRVTKRATVLVEDVAGRPYSDGRRYSTYYIPLTALKPLA
jgi:hypothetical protein